QRFHGVAGAQPLGLGVDGDGNGLVAIGVVVDVDVADAVEVLDDRHLGVFGHELDQATTAARHDDVDVIGHGQQRRNRFAVGGGDDLHRVRRQAGVGQAAGDAGGNGLVRLYAFRAAAQNR